MYCLNECILRPLEEADIEQVLIWRNSDHVRLHMFNDELIDLSQHRSWFTRINGNPAFTYLLFLYQQKPAGLVSFSEISFKNGTTKWGFYLGDEAHSPGLGKVMGCLGLDYAFDNLKLRKLTGEVLAGNTRSVRFHEKLGFVREGLFRLHIYKHGKFEDVLVFSLFSEVWRQYRESVATQLFAKK
jgi:UDP-4-amino-4,6-dideoxy-N-acetyl-beta-L-altrosamine N-acetyltransferase